MRIEQRIWTEESGWIYKIAANVGKNADLVLLFGAADIIKQSGVFYEIRAMYPAAFILGCSTAGEICGVQVFEKSLVATAVQFDHTSIQGATVHCGQLDNSYEAGFVLASKLPKAGLRHVFVLSEGVCVNGSDLVRGLSSMLPNDIGITGGLAGDSVRFRETHIMLNGPAQTGLIGAVGLYGDRLKIGYGSRGGWDPFGPERLVTRSLGNVLYEMDGRCALDLYKDYLGEHARGLPATGMLFPLSLRSRDADSAVVRTILSVDEEGKSLTYAGDIPEGTYVRLMKANIDRLIGGAISAAEASREAVADPTLSILISCIGRKLVLKQRTEEEIEGVQQILGEKVAITGFYSYGEICPHQYGVGPALHNQTMTITTLAED